MTKTHTAMGTSEEKQFARLIGVMRRRRVTRSFSRIRLDRRELEALVEAGYWAPSGSNRRPVKLVVIESRRLIRRVLAVSPGILGEPTALIVLCLDWSRAPHLVVDDPRTSHSLHVDVGASMSNVLLGAEALGIGACPVMSFYRKGVRDILELPEDWTPIITVVLGHPAEPIDRERRRIVNSKANEFTKWIAESDAGEPEGTLLATGPGAREALLELMLYLGAAARGNIEEASNYGPLRLLEGAQRAERLLDELGLSDDELRAYGQALSRDAMTILKDEEVARATADRLLALVMARLRSGGTE